MGFGVQGRHIACMYMHLYMCAGASEFTLNTKP